MSCPHGNSDDECDLCAALDAKWDAGYAAGKKTAAVEIEAVRASALVEIDILRAENAELQKNLGGLETLYFHKGIELAALREKLQGGVVVPREPTERTSEAGRVACYMDHNPEDGKLHLRVWKAMLAAAKETKE